MPETVHQNPMRAWLERNLGKAILTLTPVLLMALAGWILSIQGEIASLKSKEKEDEAQWSALLSLQEKVKAQEVEVELYKRLFYLMAEKGTNPEAFHLERAFPKVSETAESKPFYRSIPGAIPEASREERLEDFKQEELSKVQQQKH